MVCLLVVIPGVGLGPSVVGVQVEGLLDVGLLVKGLLVGQAAGLVGRRSGLALGLGRLPLKKLLLGGPLRPLLPQGGPVGLGLWGRPLALGEARTTRTPNTSGRSSSRLTLRRPLAAMS